MCTLPPHPRQPKAKTPRAKGVKNRKTVYLNIDYDYNNDIVITFDNQHQFSMVTFNEGDPGEVMFLITPVIGQAIVLNSLHKESKA
jgi:hypothetical protein